MTQTSYHLKCNPPTVEHIEPSNGSSEEYRDRVGCDSKTSDWEEDRSRGRCWLPRRRVEGGEYGKDYYRFKINNKIITIIYWIGVMNNLFDSIEVILNKYIKFMKRPTRVTSCASLEETTSRDSQWSRECSPTEESNCSSGVFVYVCVCMCNNW